MPSDSPSDNFPFSMKFDMRMIDQLGLRLYQTLPPVISELVSNAWDADASFVDITIPTSVINPESKITVKDDGIGMDRGELNNKYLSIGRCRRTEGPIEKTPKGRPVMGRKGIGKLSVFGVADGVTVETIKDGRKNSFSMSLEEIRKTSGQEYYPKVVVLDQETKEGKGTTITLKNLKRKKKIEIEEISGQLSKRFSILSSEFEVRINGKPIKPYLEIIKGETENENQIEEFLDEYQKMRVYGWIVTLKKPSNDAGITIMAHGKMVQEPFFFSEPMGRHFAYSYMIGVINADFLDEQEDDITATDRRSVSWDDEDAGKLMEWGQKKIAEIRGNWDKNRVKIKRKQIFNEDRINEWYNGRGKVEKELIDDIIEKIVESQVSDDKIVGLVEAISEKFDYELYTELVKRFKETPPQDFNQILDLINEWSFIEARDTLKVVKGRLEMIETLKRFVASDVYEKTIQEHLYKYPWLIHPTFISWEKEIGLTTLLKTEFPESEQEEGRKRVDLVCLGTGTDIYVIELKRATHKLDYADITQLKRYMSVISEKAILPEVGDMGVCPGKRVFGYLIGGDISRDSLTSGEISRLKSQQDIAVMTYPLMIDHAQKQHKDFIKDLEDSKQESLDAGIVPLGKKVMRGNLKDYATQL